MEGLGALLGHPGGRNGRGPCRLELSRARSALWALRDHLAVYAHLMEACWVGDEVVTPQPGRFYGGWITKDLKGPFKGVPGSLGW